MEDLEQLSKLLDLLKSNGVSFFKKPDLEVGFHVEQHIEDKIHSTQDHVIDAPINETTIPPDLRTDNINSFDSVLNWSASGGGPDPSIPGTGDGDLQ